MLNLLRKSWRSSNQDSTKSSPDAESSPDDSQIISNTRKRSVSPNTNGSGPAAKRAKISYTLEIAKDVQPDDGEEELEHPVQFPVPVFRFDKRLASTTPLTPPDVVQTIVDWVNEKNTILVVEDAQPPMEIYVPVLQSSKVTSITSNLHQISLVVTADTSHTATQARMVSIASKAMGGKTHLTTHTIASIPEHGSKLREEINSAWNCDVLFLSPTVLDHLLSYDYVSLSQVKQIILLDDIRNTKEDDLIPNTLSRFYGALDKSQRPRLLAFILGASPSTTYNDAFLLAEELLFSEMYGISEAARNVQIARLAKPDDIFTLYDAEIATDLPPLFHSLQKIDPYAAHLGREFATSRQLRKDLGSIATALFWNQFIDDPVTRAPRDIPKGRRNKETADPVANTGQLKVLEEARTIIKKHETPKIEVDRSSLQLNVSPKFLKLCQILAPFELEGKAFRGIILVEGIATAITLATMLQQVNLPFIRIRSITPTGPNKDPADTDNIRNSATLEDFRAGKINLIVTTSVGEDSLDLALATCVIRWDVPRNFVSYCHSKGRAHPKRSRFIIMFEKGNDRHRRIAHALKRVPSTWSRWITQLGDDLRYGPPNDMLNQSIFTPAQPEFDDTPMNSEVIIDCVSGSKLTSSYALEAVYAFASMFSEADIRDQGAASPILECRRSDDEHPQFSYVVNLPRTPLGTVLGPWCRFKADARRLACFLACEELHRLRVLNARFFPPPPLLRPPITSSHAEAQSVAPDWVVAASRVKFWELSLESCVKNRFYPTVISLQVDPHLELDEELRPLCSGPFGSICILSPSPLPALPPFDLHLLDQRCTVHLTQCAALDLDESETREALRFSERFCQAVTNRNLELACDFSPCIFVPLTPQWNEDHPFEDGSWPFPLISQYLSWVDIRQLNADSGGTLGKMPRKDWESLIMDSVLQERRDPKFVLHLGIRLRPDLNPYSKIPGQTSNHANLLQSHVALWPDFPGVTDGGQPLIETMPIPRHLNLFNTISQEPLKKGKKHRYYCIPELTRIYPLPARYLRTGLCIPSIMRRINDMLLEKTLNAVAFQGRIDDRLLLQALTPNSALMNHNYQRLEFFGDSFLKYMSSIYVVVLDPDAPEEQLHLRRAGIVQNSTLRQAAITSGLTEYIMARPFIPRNWLPPGYLGRPRSADIKGRGAKGSELVQDVSSDDDMAIEPQNEEPEDGPTDPYTTSRNEGSRKQKKPDHAQPESGSQAWTRLAPKRIADVVESVTGAAYLSGGDELALTVCKAIGLPIPNISRWSDFARKVIIPSLNDALPITQEQIKEIEDIIGFKFAKPELLQLALTHKTAAAWHTETYERFEFLGDAVLDFLTVQYLYEKYPDYGPGKLTVLKARLVSLGPLSTICVENGLAKHLIYGSIDLRSKIDTFEAAIRNAKAEVERLQDGEVSKEYWTGLNTPKELSDTIEALLGALLMSEDFDCRGARAMFDKILKPFFDRYCQPDTAEDLPSNQLITMFQKRKCDSYRNSFREYVNRGVKSFVRTITIHDVVLVELEGPNLAITSYTSSQMALDALEGDPGFLAICDCATKVAERRQMSKADRLGKKNAARVVEAEDAAEVDSLV